MNWIPVTECWPLYEGTFEVSYRCPDSDGNFFWNTRAARYIGNGVFVLSPSGKRLKNAISAWRYLNESAPYIPDDWDESKDREYWNECEFPWKDAEQSTLEEYKMGL